MAKKLTGGRRALPAIQPIRIDEWKTQHGIEDFPGGIAPRQLTSATVYFFRHPEQLYGGQKEGGLIACHMTSSWPEENIQAGDTLIVRAGPVRAGQLVHIQCTSGDLVSRLLKREANGTIQIMGSTQIIYTLRREQYELAGEVIDCPDAVRRVSNHELKGGKR